MPWKISDVEDHIKGLTPEEKKTWVEIANNARRVCIEKGGNEADCDAAAIRTANGVIMRNRENSANVGRTPSAATIFDLMLAQLSVGDYAPIRFEYSATIQGIVREYLYSDNVRITRFRNDFKKAILQAFYPAFELGLVDGGGEAPARDEDLDWINAKAEAEFGYTDSLFESLRALKKQSIEEGLGILEGVAEARGEGYAKTLDGIYGEGKIRGAKNMMLTFGGVDGAESCPTCQRMKGKRHKASWWIGHGLVPGQPGNSSFECRGWNCQHILFSDKGEIFTV